MTEQKIYVIETYPEEPQKEPITYTAKDKNELVKYWSWLYKDVQYPIMSVEHWKRFLYVQKAIDIYEYETLEEIKKELDDPTGWLANIDLHKERCVLEKLYNDNYVPL